MKGKGARTGVEAGAEGKGGSADEIDSAGGSGFIGIQDVARRLKITQRALRFYEDKGLIEPERVNSTRLYSRREVARIQLILRGKRLGFSLREIKEFLDLYDADPEHLEQMTRLAVRVRERLKDLDKQKRALDQTIAELRQIEKETIAHVTRLSDRSGS